MKNILFLLLFIPIITLSQTETYVDGKLIKSIVKNDIEVSTSFKGFHKEDGKYYTFEISVFNGSSTNKLVKVQDFAAFIETRKGNKPLKYSCNTKHFKPPFFIFCNKTSFICLIYIFFDILQSICIINIYVLIVFDIFRDFI